MDAVKIAQFSKRVNVSSKKKMKNYLMLEGWTTPTLARHGGQWVIWSDKQTVFVPLDKATTELLAACPGAVEQLRIDNEEPF